MFVARTVKSAPAAAAALASGRCEWSMPGRKRMEEYLRHHRLDIIAFLTESLFVSNGSQLRRRKSQVGLELCLCNKCDMVCVWE